MRIFSLRLAKLISSTKADSPQPAMIRQSFADRGWFGLVRAWLILGILTGPAWAQQKDGTSPQADAKGTTAKGVAADGGSGRGGADRQPTAEQIEFFERQIRPVLVEHCAECHSAGAKEVQGRLRLDSAEGVRRGGESGPAVVPGKPDASLLIKALRYDGLEMPPKSRLPAPVIANFVKWVEMGAPDPRRETKGSPGTEPGGPSTMKAPSVANMWSLAPIHGERSTDTRQAAWIRGPIDAAIARSLDQQKITASPPADPQTRLRRLKLDLVGLPMTFEESSEFNDESPSYPDLMERWTDRLLASPAFGERWARHWMDVARYADTKDGVLMYGDDRVRPFAYTYRDYVIRALNDDVPYDQFVREQLAADLIEPKVEPWRLAAMGFLTLGRLFDNNVHDVIDDRIDVVGRGLLGLTLACARCHDHKYDPVPQADYYSLYGVFASSEAPFELPLIGDPQGAGAEFEAKLAAKRDEARKFLDTQYELLTETARQRVTDYLIRVATTKPDPSESSIYFLSLAPEDLRPPLINRWRRYLEERATPDDPVFAPWHAQIGRAHV